jgi:hypothetical protein
MSRTPATFKQADIVRAVKAARACGLDVVRTEIGPDGRIVIVHQPEKAPGPASEFDEWKAKKHARSA